MSFEHNVFFINADGYREHIKTLADTAADLAALREQVLTLLKQIGATPDTWKSDNSSYPKEKQQGVSSKLAKAAGAPEAPQAPPKVEESETTGESVGKMAESGFLTPEQAEEVAKNVGADVVPTASVPGKNPNRLQAAAAKTNRDKLVERIDSIPRTQVTAPAPTDMLKGSKLAKYARPEKG